MKILVIAMSTLALIGSSLACGGSDTQAAERAALDQVVPKLPNGLSVGEVEERLGKPRTQFEAEDAEIVLIYGNWHLVFKPALFKRTRYFKEGYWPAGKPVAPLDRQIRALKLEISRQAVERDIGQTEAWEILALGSNERIWYGNGRWKLHFKDRRLSGKTLYR